MNGGAVVVGRVPTSDGLTVLDLRVPAPKDDSPIVEWVQPDGLIVARTRRAVERLREDIPATLRY